MGYVSFDSLNNVSEGTNAQGGSNVGFFTLKNDGDEAIVRFMHDTTASFEILATHSIQFNGRFRRISCIRTPQDPIDACPLCARGDKLEYRFYIHLIQYTNNPDGTVSAEPKIWERSLSYANKLKEYINNYGPMSDVICKIVRHGRAGDMKTEYEIIPNLNQNVYNPAVFKKVDNLFENYKALGRVVFDKNAQEISYYLMNGDFPAKEGDTAPAPATPTPTPAPIPTTSDAGWKKVDEAENPWSTTAKTEPWNYARTSSQPTTERPAVPNWAFNEQTTTAPAMTRPTRY